MHVAVTVVLVLVACFLEAFGDVVQHRALAKMPNARVGGGGILRAFGNVEFLAGLGLFCVGAAVHVSAIALGGSVIIVQTLAISLLVWVLVLAVAIEHVRLGLADYAGSALVVGGLVLFVVVLGTPSNPADAVNYGGWVLAIVIVVLVSAMLILISANVGSGPAAALAGTAAGFMAALFFTLVSVVFTILRLDGIGGAFANWVLYATLVVGAAAIVVQTIAFKAGPVTASVPPLVVFNPALSTILGLTLLGETVHETPLDLVLIAVAWGLMIVGIVFLSRSDIIAAEFANPEDAEIL